MMLTALAGLVLLFCIWLTVLNLWRRSYLLVAVFSVATLAQLWNLVILVGPIQIGGTMIHAIYGIYPAVIPCEQGMALYPQQSCRGVVEFELKSRRAGEPV